MILLQNLHLPLDTDFDHLIPLAARRLRLEPSAVRSARLYRKSVDARKKDAVVFCCSLLVEVACGEAALVRRLRQKDITVYQKPPRPHLPAAAAPPRLKNRPLVVGCGPAGLFAALTLARAGLHPLLIERGQDVDARQADVERFWRAGKLDPESNVQFGEGGAGTFSDGKLNTGIKDPRCRQVLETFVECGAPSDILYEHKPHVGTDLLADMVKNMRRRIIEAGGEVRFSCRLTHLVIENGRVAGAAVSDAGVQREILCPAVILAIGHSARDTLASLYDGGVPMEAKAFAVGARIEHPQPLIDRAQYGNFAGHPALGAADYKLSAHLENGRGVYTFCMCPGGQVVAAASEPGRLVTNGMSRRARDGRNANSALLVGVTPTDYGSRHPLAGVAFQRHIEEAAFAVAGDYRAPAQRVEDFLAGRPSTDVSGGVVPTYRPGVVPASMEDFLPLFITEAMREGIRLLDRRLRGFAASEALLTGPETRSSSPVRIRRGDNCQSSIRGLFPCGEGAGYAGGIVSAAVDGLRCAEAVISGVDGENG